jgi:hypothetical protein
MGLSLSVAGLKQLADAKQCKAFDLLNRNDRWGEGRSSSENSAPK